MKNKFALKATGILTASLIGASAIGITAFAAPGMTRGGEQQQFGGMMQGDGQQQFGGMMQNGRQMSQNSNVTLADSASAIVSGNTSNSAQSLTADTANATTITMSATNSEVKISESGTYIITGSCSDGNITVKKGTTGVVLILRDLTLTSTSGAPLSLNKGSEVKVVIDGSVKLTDAENTADENSSDADTADAFDGAAIKVKDGASVYITGTGTLTLDASSCKNGIKSGDDAATSLVLDGPSLSITAANDGINAGYDLAILSGSVTVSAGDDGIHAGRILTIDGNASVNIEKSYEGLEGTVVNIFGGDISVTATDDGINAANSDDAYTSEIDCSINITGGTVTVNAGSDGLDSNGNVNLTGGTITIKSANNGGDAGIDYDGSLYISDSVTLNNASGIAGPDNMGGMGGMPQGGFNSRQNGASQTDRPNGSQSKQQKQTTDGQAPQSGQTPQERADNRPQQGQMPQMQQEQQPQMNQGNMQPGQMPQNGNRDGMLRR